MWSQNGEKSPGPDGFNASFYKANWDVVGPDICTTVQYFSVRIDF